MDISSFQKIKVLGEGTFGKCYLVNNKSNNELCVLKQIDMNGMNDKQKQDTMKQARILQALDHPSIIKFIGSFKSRGGYLNIVMNYADGGDMAKAIKQAKGVYFSENQILNWFTQICLAMRHIHDRKIIHRDIKCENIFLTKDKMVKLGDFGIAKSLKQTIEKLKSVVGTPYYMSPEICDNKDYSFKTDIWSLGVILYELCALKPPFQANSLGALALKILKGQFPPLPNYYSKELRKLISEILTVDAAKRPNITQILKNPLITSRIANYVQKNTSFIRGPEISLLKEVGDESSRSKKARVGSLFSPQNVPCGQSPTLFPVQTPQNKNISISSKFKQNSSYQKNLNQKQENYDKHTRRALRRREFSQPNLTPKLLYNNDNTNKLRRNNFTSNVQLDKKRSEDGVRKRRKRQDEPNSNNLLMQLEEIKEINSEVRELHQQVETIDRQLTARHEPETEDKYFTEYPIEELEEILYQEEDQELEEHMKKELELKKTYNVIMKKYEGTDDEVDFSYQTQVETLKGLIQAKIGPDRTPKVIDIVRKAKGFPAEQLLDNLLTKEEQKQVVPLTAIYYYYIECE